MTAGGLESTVGTDEGQALLAGITKGSRQLRVNFLDSELFNFKQAKGFILCL